jgi:beta-carotene 3-hydroxylase
VTTVLAWLAWFLAALLSMEGVAYLTHRYLMHGPMWVLHRSHHLPHRHGLEWNDLFGVLFAIPSIVLIYLGTSGGPSVLLPIGAGMTAYGALYFLFHDIVVHRRVRVPRLPQPPYLRRIVKAHLIHHRTHRRHGAESFGFLYAPTTFHERPPSTFSSRP